MSVAVSTSHSQIYVKFGNWILIGGFTMAPRSVLWVTLLTLLPLVDGISSSLVRCPAFPSHELNKLSVQFSSEMPKDVSIPPPPPAGSSSASNEGSNSNNQPNADGGNSGTGNQNDKSGFFSSIPNPLNVVANHCIASNGGECWQSRIPPHIRLNIMCGMSGGSGLRVIDGPCPEDYTVNIGGSHIFLFGMSFWARG